MKRQRKKYLKPSHPWERDRIDAENKLLHRYGLLQKEEIWKTETLLRNLRRQARHLLATPGPQAELESKQLLARLHRLGLVGKDATLDDVLSLSIENLLERRLQTIVHRKGLARTPRQARQLVTHGHVTLAGRRVSAPSYLVPLEEEDTISYVEGSPFKEQQKPPETPAAGSDIEVERGTEGAPKEESG